MLALLLWAALAQNPTDLFHKAPPGVEEALRARIGEFYGLHVSGKFRQAEALVAEDTKDFFYTANKPKYLSCEISRIEYGDEFRKAKATMVCEQIVPFPGFGNRPVKVPFASQWKLEDGQWFWYVDPESINRSPFGEMKPGPAGPGVAPATGLATAPRPEMLRTMVKADRGQVQFKSGEEASERVTIRSALPGIVTLSLEAPKLKGIDAKLDRAQIKPGEVAVLTIKAEAGAEPTDAKLQVRVEQTNQVIPVRVSVTR